MTEPTDEEWFRRYVVDGDRSVLDRLVQRHLDRAYGLARRCCGHDGDAEDAVQDACLRLIATAWRYDGSVPFVAWWCRLVKDAAIDRVRKRQRRAHREAALDAEPVAPAASAPVSADADVVREAVHALKPAYRDVVVLHYFGQLSLAEIAATLSIRPGTVGARLTRARKHLEGRLRRRGFPGAAAVCLAAFTAAPPLSASSGLSATCASAVSTTAAASVSTATAVTWKGLSMLTMHPWISAILMTTAITGGVAVVTTGGPASPVASTGVSSLVPTAPQEPTPPAMTGVTTDEPSPMLDGDDDEVVLEVEETYPGASPELAPGQPVMRLYGNGQFDYAPIVDLIGFGLPAAPDQLTLRPADRARIEQAITMTLRHSDAGAAAAGADATAVTSSLRNTTVVLTAKTSAGPYRSQQHAPEARTPRDRVSAQRRAMQDLARVVKWSVANSLIDTLDDAQLQTLFDQLMAQPRPSQYLRLLAAPQWFDQAWSIFTTDADATRVHAAGLVILGLTERHRLAPARVHASMMQYLQAPAVDALHMDGLVNPAWRRLETACAWAGIVADADMIEPLWGVWFAQPATRRINRPTGSPARLRLDNPATAPLAELARQGIGMVAGRGHVQAWVSGDGVATDHQRLAAVGEILPWLADRELIGAVIESYPAWGLEPRAQGRLAWALSHARVPGTVAAFAKQIRASTVVDPALADTVVALSQAWAEDAAVRGLAESLQQRYPTASPRAFTWLWRHDDNAAVLQRLDAAREQLRMGNKLDVHLDRPATVPERVVRLYELVVPEAASDRHIRQWTGMVHSFWPEVGDPPAPGAAARSDQPERPVTPPPGADGF